MKVRGRRGGGWVFGQLSNEERGKEGRKEEWHIFVSFARMCELVVMGTLG